MALSVIADDGSVATGGFGDTVASKLSLFCADDGLIGSREDQWLQQAMDVLVGVFRRVGWAANVGKTKTMTCFPGSMRTGLSNQAYERRVTGQGDSYRQRLHRRLPCPECGKNLAVGSLTHHRRRQHGVEPEIDWEALNPGVPSQPMAHPVSFPTHDVTHIECPVGGCLARLSSRAAVRSHFASRHWNDAVHVLEEHPLAYPKCDGCGLQVPFASLNNRHFNSASCRRGAMRKLKREQHGTFCLRGQQCPFYSQWASFGTCQLLLLSGTSTGLQQ